MTAARLLFRANSLNGGHYRWFRFSFDRVHAKSAFTYIVLHQASSRYMADYGLSKSSFNILVLLRHGPAEGMQLHELGEIAAGEPRQRDWI